VFRVGISASYDGLNLGDGPAELLRDHPEAGLEALAPI
jgi:hypothetical protein